MSEQIKDGGPVFPVEHYTQSRYESTGMTLRDYFAAKAMAAIITMPDGSTDGNYYEDTVAANAYLMADAMLAAREKQL